MYFLRLEYRVMKDEGWRSEPYKCSADVVTIGYGTTRIFDKPVTMSTPPVTREESRYFLRAQLYQALIDAQGLFPRFDEMNAVRQECLANLAFNLGANRLALFVRLRAAANDLLYQAMAEEMVASVWYGQVGDRARRMVYEMATGKLREL